MNIEDFNRMSKDELDAYVKEMDESGQGFLFLEGRYYLGTWHGEFAATPKNKVAGNILILAWRQADKPLEWVIQTRIRWYVDDKIHDSEDRKSWRRDLLKGADEAGVLYVVSSMVAAVYQKFGTLMEPYMIRGGAEEASKRIAGLPFMHRQEGEMPR